MSRKSKRLWGCTCPYCGAAADGYTEPHGEDVSPKPGDICACLYCAQPSVYEKRSPRRFVLRELSDEEWADLPAEMLQTLSKMQTICHEAKKEFAR